MATQVFLTILILVIAIVSMMIIYATRYKRVPPNKAMVVYGRRMGPGGPGYKVISGGGKFIVPIIESYEFLPLDVRALEFDLDDVRTVSNGEERKAHLVATAQVKIASEPSGLKVAAEHLLGKPDEEIDKIAHKMFEGSLRTIFRDTAFEELDKSRDTMAMMVQQIAAQDLLNIGIEIRGFQVHDCRLKG
jgi:flotillin